MAIDVQWMTPEKEVLLVIYGERWSLEDYYLAIDRSTQMMDEVNHLVHIIQDASGMKEYPTKLLSAGSYTEKKAHPRRGIMIMVGLNRFIQSLLNIGKVIAPKATQDMYFVETMEQAKKKLSELRETS
jgi:hypothetical protein